MYGGKYYMGFVGNLLGFPAIKEFWKSVKNWQSYCHEFGVQFFWPTLYICKWSQTDYAFNRFRVIQPECAMSFFVLVFQSCVGVFIQSLMTGLIFCKLARPKQRAHTIIFSRLAVVCKRDCEYQLLFRVGNMRRSQIIATSIRAIMVKDRYDSA